ncbi:thiamine pyrophosphate-dependent enzyme [Paenibacillus rhizoplanae]
MARYGDAEGLLAEVMGKQGAVCNGIGGSQHIRRDRFISTGIQAEGIAVGTGIAWSYKYKQQDNLVFVYIGDGTFGRGCVYESLNFAGIWNLPMVIVVENNGIAISTHQSYSMSGSIEGRVRGFDLDYLCIQSKAVNEIREQTGDAIHRVRKESKPLVMEFITDRVASHSKGDDTRSADELERVRENYWYNQMKASDKARVDKLEEAVRNQMQTLQELVIHREGAEWADYEKKKKINENLRHAIHQLMCEDEAVVVIGEDVREPYGGAFKINKGLSDDYPDRVIGTPISEEGFVNMASGMAIMGHKPIVDMMFFGFHYIVI